MGWVVLITETSQSELSLSFQNSQGHGVESQIESWKKRNCWEKVPREDVSSFVRSSETALKFQGTILADRESINTAQVKFLAKDKCYSQTCLWRRIDGMLNFLAATYVNEDIRWIKVYCPLIGHACWLDESFKFKMPGNPRTLKEPCVIEREQIKNYIDIYIFVLITVIIWNFRNNCSNFLDHINA